MFTIYKYTSPEQKVYIGCTKHSLRNRAGLSGRGYKTKSRFWEAISRLGWNSFIPEVLATTEDANEAARLELAYIKQYQATNPEFGYNTETVGYSQSDEDYSAKVSEGTKRGLSSPETRQKMSEAQKTKWSDPEYHARTQAAMKAACNTDEHRKNVSDAQKIAQNRPEVKAKLSSAFTGLVFINNGFCSKRVTQAEAERLIATGTWSKGRMCWGPRGPVDKLKGRVWVHKEAESKFIENSQLKSYLNSGWEKGRGKLKRGAEE